MGLAVGTPERAAMLGEVDVRPGPPTTERAPSTAAVDRPGPLTAVLDDRRASAGEEISPRSGHGLRARIAGWPVPGTAVMASGGNPAAIDLPATAWRLRPKIASCRNGSRSAPSSPITCEPGSTGETRRWGTAAGGPMRSATAATEGPDVAGGSGACRAGSVVSSSGRIASGSRPPECARWGGVAPEASIRALAGAMVATPGHLCLKTLASPTCRGRSAAERPGAGTVSMSRKDMCRS